MIVILYLFYICLLLSLLEGVACGALDVSSPLLDELIQIDREHKNTIVVRVLTVRPLKDSQREAMIQKLSERYNKKIILEELKERGVI